MALLPLTFFQKGNFFPAQLYRANAAHSIGVEAGFENKAVCLHNGGITFITCNVYLYFGNWSNTRSLHCCNPKGMASDSAFMNLWYTQIPFKCP